jgi:gamma-polyglutamate biosynthesis protein CapA
VNKDIIQIVAVGDIFLGEHPVTLGHGVNSIVKEKGSYFLFEKIKDHLKDGDITCANLEGIISPKLSDETGIKSDIFWGDPSCANSLKSAGFSCLFLANNHAAQHGINALKRTGKLLDDNNIKWTGFNPENPDVSKAVFFKINDLKVGILAYCETQQYNLDTPILAFLNMSRIREDINDLKQKCDIIIISLHWGDEFIDYPSPDQIIIAHNIIDMGAHLIIGSHSHTMQGIERYKNGLIVYSLGSFIKDLWPKKLRESVILRCKLSSKGVESFSFEPIIINKQYQPEVYQGKASKKFIDRVYSLSKEIESFNLKMRDAFKARNKYEKDVRRLLLIDRIGTIFHYIKNIFKYDKAVLLNNIKLMLLRRISKKNI